MMFTSRVCSPTLLQTKKLNFSIVEGLCIKHFFIKLQIIYKEVHYLGLTFQFLHQFLIKTSQNVKLPLQALVHLLHIVGAPKSFAVVLFVIMHITSPDLLNVAQKKSPAHKFCHLPKEDKTMSSLQDTRLVSPLSLLPAT